MKVSVEFSEEELGEISRLTGITKKGPAIRKLLIEALQLKRRAEISAKFLSNEWSAGLEGFEESKAADRSKATTLASAWQ